jgi:histidyl-tRNA synthetase
MNFNKRVKRAIMPSDIMALSTKPYKGARDFYPEDKRVQKYMFNTMRRVVESFGYQEYDAPIIEPIELYLSKTSAEIVAEQTYNFLDRGDRHLTLRPEMTPTVTRMVAGKRQELPYPLRWYSIPNLWRYERPQLGRLREHWQLNVDIFGAPGLEADHEIILIADSILKAFGAKRDMYEIRVNSRALINWLFLEYLRLDYPQTVSLTRLIDRMHKMPEKEFLSQVDAVLSPEQKESGALKHLNSILKTKKISDLPFITQQHPAVAEIQSLIRTLNDSGVKNVAFDITLMRGFDYYTNIVFEVFDTDPKNNRSMFGGGRYDGLVELFGVDPLPIVGFGMGDVTLQNFLETHHLMPVIHPETDAVAILIGDVYPKVQPILKAMRAEGARIAVDATERKTEAKIKSAAKAGISYVIFIGEDELQNQRFKLKNISNGQEHEHSLERIVSILDARHRPEDNL